ncbi:inositol monophosphatase, partial [Mycobacterium simiae]
MTPTDSEPARLRSVAETLATEAAEFVRGRRAEIFGVHPAGAGSGSAVRAKTTPTDPVTVVDTDTERLLRTRLAQLRPGDPILGEEGGGPSASTATAAGAVTWVLDPIDGTVNFVYSIPAYAVSVGAQVGGVSVAGAVADVVGGKVYSAAVGRGAHVTDAQGSRELRCTGVDELSMSLLGTGFGYSTRRRAAQAAVLAGMLPMVRDVRR